MAPLALDTIGGADFTPLVGTAFRARAFRGDDPVEVALILESVEIHGDPRPFSLCFLGPGAAPLEQSMYPLAHESLGEADIFLVPIGADAEGRRYEAVFA